MSNSHATTETTNLYNLTLNNAFNTIGIKGLKLKKLADKIKAEGIYNEFTSQINNPEA
jgi:hypothetical protein